MEILSLLLLGLPGIFFIIMSAVHLYGCWNGESAESRALADTTKSMLMPLLLASVAFFDFLTRKQPTLFTCLLAPALVFSTVGDFALLGNTILRTVTGVIGFAFAHLVYVLMAWTKIDVNGLSDWRVIAAAVAAAAVLVFMLIYLKKHNCKMFPIVAIYGFVITFMSFSFWAVAIQAGFTLSTVFMAIGSLIFMLSDFILSHGMFMDIKLPRSRFLVMSTYILAQVLIVLGAGVLIF